MDRDVQAHNQLQLNLEVPYDIRRLEARLKPPPPVVIERLTALQLPQSRLVGANSAAHAVTAAEQAGLGMLSRDRLAAAQVLARHDLRQRVRLADAQQRLARAVTASVPAARRAPSMSPLPTAGGGGSPRMAAATRIVSSMALANGRRTPDRPGSGNRGAKSASAVRAAAKSEPKKRLSSVKASVARPSVQVTTGSEEWPFAFPRAAPVHAVSGVPSDDLRNADLDSPPPGTGVAASVTAVAAAADSDARIGSAQLSALQEHIRTIESELQLLGSLVGKSSRKDEALRRLSESHRGAIQALQSFASDLPNRKRSEGNATYEQLSSMMGQLSQLCTQLELAGAAAPSKDPQEAAREELVSAGGSARLAALAALSGGAMATAMGLRPSKKAAPAGSKRVKSSPAKVPSERLYPRLKSAAQPTRKAASAGTSSARRSPYAPRQSPTIVSPYLTKPLAGGAAAHESSAIGTSAATRSAEPGLRRASGVRFGDVVESSSPDVPRATGVGTVDRGEKPSLGSKQQEDEDGLLAPANFLERLMDARKRYTDNSSFARGAYSNDGDADDVDPMWLDETTNTIRLRQQQQREPGNAASPVEAGTNFVTGRMATSKVSADRLSAAASTGSLRRAQQQQRSAETAGATWELKDRDAAASSRKPSADSLNTGLSRMLEAKVSSNGDLLADMILSELVEDTAREMAELEQGERVGDGSPLTSPMELYDQLLARIDTMQAEQDNMRRRWTEVNLYVRSISPDFPTTGGAAVAAAATVVTPATNLGHGDSSSMSSSAATAGAVQSSAEHGGEEGRALTFTRRSRSTAAQASNQPKRQQLEESEAACESEARRRPASQPGVTVLSAPRSLLLSVAANLDEYKQFLARTYQVTTSEFDPAQFVEECASELQEDCVEAVASELGKAASDIVDALYKDEFVTAPSGEANVRSTLSAAEC